MSYAQFLQAKERRAHRVGDIPSDIHPFLHDWQREVVQWACGVGRAAIWADTGLGKTVMQLEWGTPHGRARMPRTRRRPTTTTGHAVT